MKGMAMVSGFWTGWSAAVLALAAGLTGFGLEAMGQERPRLRPHNQSSHPPEFFRELLTGRVWVYERNERPEAIYFGRDGALKGCAFLKHRNEYGPFPSEAQWLVGTRVGRSNLEINWPRDEGMRFIRRVMIHNGETGRLHAELFSTETRKWKVERDGWIQDGWPAVFRNACNEVALPWDVSMVSEQDLLDFASMRKSATPIVRFPGWQHSYLGATGIGDSGGQPTLTVEEVNRELVATEGMIRIADARALRLVSVGFPGTVRDWEVWLLNDKDDVVDIAVMRVIDDGAVFNTRWEKSGRAVSIRVGYPFRTLSTGRLHPAFAMMRDLAAAGKPASIEGVSYRFLPKGEVVSGGETGEWWLSRGEVRVKLGSGIRNWPWRTFADKAGWKRG